MAPGHEITSHTLFKGEKKFLLFILPIVYGILTFLFWYQCKSFFASYPDRIYVYLISALDIAGGSFDVGEFQHPGTPVHWIAGLTLFITHLFAGRGPLAEDVFANPEFYLRVCAVVITTLFLFIVYLSGRLVLNNTRNIRMAVLFQLVPISSYLALQYLMIMPEALILISLTYYCAFLWVLCYNRNKFPEHSFGNRNYIFFFSFMSALLITTKITCLPFLIIPLFFIRPHSKKILYLFSTVILALLIIYPIWSKIPAMYHWLYGVASHSGQYGTGKVEVVNSASFFPDLVSLFRSELFFSIGYLLISGSVIAGLLMKKKGNPFFTLAVALWLTITIQIFLTVKHYSYHYILPAQLLIIPGILAAFTSLITMKPNKVVCYSALGICLTWLLYESTISANLYKDGNAVYESSLVAKKYATLPKIITTTFGESCFVESALNYSSYYAGKDYTSYYYFLRKLYPNSFFYDIPVAGTIKWWDMPVTPAELFQNNPEVLVYFKGLFENDERSTMKILTNGIDSAVTGIHLLNYNAATSERFYMIGVDTSKIKIQYEEKITIKYDFEKKTSDLSAFLSTDSNYKTTDVQFGSTEQHFSGTHSLKLHSNQYPCCTTFSVSPGDAFDISVNYYSNDRPVGITLSSAQPGLFDRSSESIVQEFDNGWKRVNLKTTIPDDCPAKELSFCLYYFGHKTCFVDDLNITIFKKNKSRLDPDKKKSYTLSKFILKTSSDQYISYSPEKYQLWGNQPQGSRATVFEPVILRNGKYALKASNGMFVCADRSDHSNLFANRNSPGEWESFEIIFHDSTHINLKSSDGKFVCADQKLNGVLVANRNEAQDWETFSLVRK